MIRIVRGKTLAAMREETAQLRQDLTQSQIQGSAWYDEAEYQSRLARTEESKTAFWQRSEQLARQSQQRAVAAQLDAESRAPARESEREPF